MSIISLLLGYKNLCRSSVGVNTWLFLMYLIAVSDPFVFLVLTYEKSLNKDKRFLLNKASEV